MRDLIIGVDSSTSATKVVVFNPSGNTVAIATRGYDISTPHPGWSEQNPEDWWRAFSEACREVMAQPDVSADRIAGIGITHQRFSFVPVNSDMRPLRPAILWNDIRCAEEAEYARTTIGAEKVFSRTGYAPGQWTLYKALWLKKNEPNLYDRTYKIVLVQDFLIHALTGNLVTLAGAATMTGALDIETPDRWAVDIINAMGLRRDIWIDEILPGCTLAGSVTPDAAVATGLPEGLPVATTAGDQPCGILGAGVTEPGQLGINGGTSCTNEFVVDGLPSRTAQDFMIEISPSGDYIVENYIPSGGSALMKWYRGNLGMADEFEAEKNGVDAWTEIYNLAARSPVGNHGVCLLPFFQGANGPFWDLNARGLLFGLHTDHGRPEIVRAIIEGLAYESRRQAMLMEKGTGTKVSTIRMYGGSSVSDHWNQAFSDVFRVPVEIPNTVETTALGAAISAAVAVGHFASCKEAGERMVSVKKSYSPDERSSDLYDAHYARVFEPLYERTRDMMAANAEINRAYTQGV